MGDIGYINDEGYLFLTDREKFMIISGGVNIYPQESESIIVVRDDVYDCAVIGVPHDEMGEEVKAMVVLADNIKENISENPWKTEGYENGTWIILDYVDIVVHIFFDEMRSYYDLERIWFDAKVVKV